MPNRHMLSLASASLSFQASAPLTAPSTLARRANVVARDQDLRYDDPAGGHQPSDHFVALPPVEAIFVVSKEGIEVKIRHLALQACPGHLRRGHVPGIRCRSDAHDRHLDPH